jgi:hypothetical protein
MERKSYIDEVNVNRNFKAIVNYFEEQGMSKTAFCRHVGYTSTAQINEILTTTKKPSGNVLIRMVEELFVNPMYLFFGQGEIVLKEEDVVKDQLFLAKLQIENLQESIQKIELENKELKQKNEELSTLYAELLESTSKAIQHYRTSTHEASPDTVESKEIQEME